jgi:hypothetical protein
MTIDKGFGSPDLRCKSVPPKIPQAESSPCNCPTLSRITLFIKGEGQLRQNTMRFENKGRYYTIDGKRYEWRWVDCLCGLYEIEETLEDEDKEAVENSHHSLDWYNGVR